MINNDLGVKVFNRHADEYDKWFDRNWDIYQAEVNALKRLVPGHGYGLEVGVGSGGRFSAAGAFIVDVLSPVKENQSGCMSKNGAVLIDEARLYHLISSNETVEDSLLLTFNKPGNKEAGQSPRFFI